MRKLLVLSIALTALTALTACNKDPKQITIAETENLTKYKEEIKSALTEDEMKILARYFFQNGLKVDKSLTIQQALDYQKNIDTQREQQAQDKTKSITEGIQSLNQRYWLNFPQFKDKEQPLGPALVTFQFTNNTGKTIKAITPQVQFVLNDQIVYTDRITSTIEFNPPLENGKTQPITTMVFGTSTEGQAIITAFQNMQNVIYGFIGIETVFSDATVEKVSYLNQ